MQASNPKPFPTTCPAERHPRCVRELQAITCPLHPQVPYLIYMTSHQRVEEEEKPGAATPTEKGQGPTLALGGSAVRTGSGRQEPGRPQVRRASWGVEGVSMSVWGLRALWRPCLGQEHSWPDGAPSQRPRLSADTAGTETDGRQKSLLQPHSPSCQTPTRHQHPTPLTHQGLDLLGPSSPGHRIGRKEGGRRRKVWFGLEGNRAKHPQSVSLPTLSASCRACTGGVGTMLAPCTHFTNGDMGEGSTVPL